MFNELIKGLELSEEQVEKLTENFKGIETQIKEVVENDPEIIRKHKTGAFEEAKRKLKNALNLSNDEVNGLDIDDFVKVAKGKVQETVKATETEKDKTILTLKEQIQKFETEVIPSLKNETEAKIKEFKIETKLSDVLANVKTIGSKEVAKIALQARLANYKVDVDENGNAIVLTKDGLKPTIDNKVVTDLGEITKHILKSDGLLVENNNGEQPRGGGAEYKQAGELPAHVKAKLAEIQNL
jgi:hypothetical protein